MVLMNEDLGIEAIKQRLATFRNHLSYVDFDIPGLAREFNLDPARQKAVMIATAKKVLDITVDEIRAMSEELCDKWHALYMLSRCDSFLCSGKCNGWDIVNEFNKGKFLRSYKFHVGI
jgi:hypothetical protein